VQAVLAATPTFRDISTPLQADMLKHYVLSGECAKKCESGFYLRLFTGFGFTLSQATKALRESRSIALLYFRPLH